jgi:hypothetical protein
MRRRKGGKRFKEEVINLDLNGETRNSIDVMKDFKANEKNLDQRMVEIDSPF